MNMNTLIVSTFIFFTSALSHAQEKVIDIKVTKKGFEPSAINTSTTEEITLKVTRTSDETCSTSVQIPTLKVKKDLPLNKVVEIKLGKLKKGEIKFGCGMNMMDSGKIYVN